MLSAWLLETLSQRPPTRPCGGGTDYMRASQGWGMWPWIKWMCGWKWEVMDIRPPNETPELFLHARTGERGKATWEHSKRIAEMDVEEGDLTRTQPFWRLDLGLPASTTVRKKGLSFKLPLVCGILWRQPVQTTTTFLCPGYFMKRCLLLENLIQCLLSVQAVEIWLE